MTPEDITEMITRRQDAIVQRLLTVDTTSDEYFNLCQRLHELTELATEIRALKENETKTPN